MRHIFLTGFGLVFSASAQSAGFALIEQSASGMGNAYAGAAAVAEDASTIYFNPAGMTYLSGSQLVVAGHAIKPTARFNNQGSVPGRLPAGDEGGDLGSWAFIPNTYFSHEINPNLFAGLGISVPFGLKTEYDKDWIGRFQAVKSELKTININPALAFKVNDKLSIGAGVSAMWAQAELTRAVNGGALGERSIKIKGDDWGFGFNLGAIYQITPDTRFGVAYRSKVEQELAGDAKSSLTQLNALPLRTLNTDVNADLTLPENFSVSAFSHINEKWDVMADITWTRWSQFKELKIVRDNGTDSTLALTPENWENTMRYSVGASYQYNEQLKLRAGLAFDQEAIKDEFRTARIPGNDRTWVSLGASWKTSENCKLDIGYAHLFIKEAKIRDIQNQPTAVPPTANGNLIGEFDGHVNILSVQYTRNF